MQSDVERRTLAFVATGLVAAAVFAGLALARTKVTPIGTGVVVIETNLAYQASSAAGTGMVLTPSGDVLTNNHVISGATTVRVVVPNTGHTYTARVVGYDRSADVALIRLQHASNLRTVAVGNSSSLTVGQAVTALGNAGGTGTLTPAKGTITGLNRSITAGDDQGVTERLTGLIEIDAPVQPGDSGGPLLDGSGRAIGMDTAASSGFVFEGSGASDAYAIPISHALSIAKAIEAGSASSTVHIGPTAFLGIEVGPVDQDPYAGFGDSPTSGGLIAAVVPGGPADRAGLEVGDVITGINGHAVASPTAITTRLLLLKPGTRIKVTYWDQSGDRYSTTVTLGSGPPQ